MSLIRQDDSIKNMNTIIMNPKIMAGKPIIKGTRIPVYLILNLLAAGYTVKRIIKAYPQLTKEDIIAALTYAQKLAEYEKDIVMPRIATG